MGKIIKTFIVDDSLNVRNGLAVLLSQIEGIEVIGEAEEVREAMESIRRLKPDVVILDIRMPGGSGIDVLRFVKREHPATVVVILTNYPFPTYRQKCMNEGADFFFDKSIEFGMVVEVCKGLVQVSCA
jgi:DNA-binding NarL/FixJ family response regulator